MLRGKVPLRRKSKKSNHRGAVLVEAVLGITTFLILVFLTCECGLVFLRAATTQYVLAREARNSVAFNQLRGVTPGVIEQRIKDRAASFGLDTQNWDITICRAAAPCSTNTLGNGTDLLIFKVNPKLRFFAGSVPLNFVASVLISRESTA